MQAKWIAKAYTGFNFSVIPMPLAPGTLLGQRYEIQAYLGLGGPIESYQALDLRLGRDVSIASLDLHNQAPEILIRFERAAQQRAAIQHPRLVTVHDFGQEGTRIYLVSQWLVGESLRRRLKQGKLPWSQAAQVGSEVLAGLDAARTLDCHLPFPDPAWIFLEAGDGTRLLAYLGLDAPETERLTQPEECTRMAKMLLDCTDPRSVPPTARLALEKWAQTPDQADPAGLRALLGATRPRPPLRSRFGKGLLGGLALLLVLVGLVGAWEWLRPKPQGATTVTVLPFTVPADQPEMAYLRSGISQHVSQALAHIPGIRIASVGAEDGRVPKITPLQLARDLKAEWVVTGQIRQQGAKLRVDAELIHVADGRVARHFQVIRPGRELLGLANDLSGNLVLALSPNPGPAPGTDPAGTQDPEAYRLYLQGRHFLAARETAGFRRAQASFQAAIARDPAYARAHAGLADTYNLMGVWQLVPPGECGRLASDSARRALTLDPDLAEAHASLAYARFRYFFDWVGAEQGFLEALRRDPHFAQGHHWYGFLLVILGRWEEAFHHLQQAVDLEPMSLPARVQLAMAFHWAGRPTDAMEQFRKVFEVDPAYRNGLSRYRVALEESGRLDEAIKVMEQETGLQSFPPEHALELRKALDKGGPQAYWKTRLHQLETGVDPVVIAAAAVHVGDHARALQILEQAWRGRVVTLAWVSRMPSFAPLKDEPRFKELLRHLGLPQEAIVAGKPPGR